MKKINLIVFLLIAFLFIFNCPTQDGSSGGGSSNEGDNSNSSSSSSSAGSKIVVQICGGEWHTAALFNDGTIKCWGLNNTGQLGYGDTNNRGDQSNEMGDDLPIVDLGTGRTAVQIAAGKNHTVALLDNGTVKCWGNNSSGQLGYEDTVRRGDGSDEMGDDLPIVDLGTGRTAVQIATGDYFTVALLDNGTIKCWGDNLYGQLGYGDTDRRGDGLNEMGDNLPIVDLGIGRTAEQIAVSCRNHIVVLLDNGTVKCWGNNDRGQLGYEDTNNRGDQSNEMGDNLPIVDLGTDRTAVQVAAGGFHTVVLLDNGTVKCWGFNFSGQLGYGDTFHRGDQSNEMGDNLPIVDLGIGRTAVQIAAGWGYSLAILDDGTVKCWGENEYGQLGYGDTDDRGYQLNQMGDDLPIVDLGTGRTAVQITSGGSQSVVILDNGAVKCWGWNDSGQLGYGDTNYRGDNSGEMGDNLLPLDL